MLDTTPTPPASGQGAKDSRGAKPAPTVEKQKGFIASARKAFRAAFSRRPLKSMYDASRQPAAGPVPNTILASAWKLHNEYNYNANRSVRRHTRLRESVIILGVIATLLAILSNITPGNTEATNPPASTPAAAATAAAPASAAGATSPQITAASNNLNRIQLWFIQHPWVSRSLLILLVIVPITSSVVLTMANKFQEGERYLALKTGAENTLRVMYIYRTILSGDPNKDQWLEDRLAEIRRETLQKVKGNLVLKQPSSQEPITVSEVISPRKYIRERLNYQIEMYTRKIDKTQKARSRLQITILALGGIGSLLAALSNMKQVDPGISIWVAFSTALAAAMGAWLELRQMDWRVQRGLSSDEREKIYSIDSEKASSRSSLDDPLESAVAIYSFIISELTSARDHWLSLRNKEEADCDDEDEGEFYELVLVVERILWGREFARDSQIQERILQTSGDSRSMPSESTDQSSSLTASISSLAQEGPAGGKEAEPAAAAIVTRGGNAPLQEAAAAAGGKDEISVRHKSRQVVVLMPAGRKSMDDGRRIDFDHVYHKLIKPVLEAEEFTVQRWTKDSAVDSIQYLLMADIVIADVSYDDSDVFYSLAIRHAFRKTGIIHVREASLKNSFKIFSVRTTEYHCNKYGRVDPAMRNEDQETLKRLVANISESNFGDNPVFNLLPYLQETERRHLVAPSAIGFWEEDDERRHLLARAQNQKRVGDILLLADEIQNPMLKEEAIQEAGQALKDIGQYERALTWYRKGKELNPRSLVFRREEGFLLNRLNRRAEAIVILTSLLEEVPGDDETIAYLGRIYKDLWYDTWSAEAKGSPVLRQKAFESNHWLIKSFETYLKGYRYDMTRVSSGINAFTLGTILVYLSNSVEKSTLKDPYIKSLQSEILPNLKAALTFTIEAKARNEKADYLILASLAELQLLSHGSEQEVKRAYIQALMAASRTLVVMRSTLRQLTMLEQLAMPRVNVEPGIRALKAELQPDPLKKRSHPAEVQAFDRSRKKAKRQVFLFKDIPKSTSTRVEDQLSEQAEKNIQDQIVAGLQNHNAQPYDLVITTNMVPGIGLILVECSTKRGIPVECYFPGIEEGYIDNFVKIPFLDGNGTVPEKNKASFKKWLDRFMEMRNHRLLDDYYQYSCLGYPRKIEQTKKEEGKGEAEQREDEFERNMRWVDFYAQVYGSEIINITVEDRDGCPLIKFEKNVNENNDPAARQKGQKSRSNGKVSHLPGTAEKKEQKTSLVSV